MPATLSRFASENDQRQEAEAMTSNNGKQKNCKRAKYSNNKGTHGRRRLRREGSGLTQQYRV